MSDTPTSPATPTIPDADFRLMVEAVADYAIFMLDSDGFVRTWNARANRLKGCEVDRAGASNPKLDRRKRWPTSGVERGRLRGAARTL